MTLDALYVCALHVCVCIYTHTHTHIYIYIYIYIYICMYDVCKVYLHVTFLANSIGRTHCADEVIIQIDAKMCV